MNRTKADPTAQLAIGRVSRSAKQGIQTVSVEDYQKRLDDSLTEEQHQIELFRQLEILSKKNPEYSMVFHIPNGGMRNKATAARLKAAGVKAGIPDLLVPVPRGKYGGLFVELKSLKRGAKLSKEQLEMIEKLRRYDYVVAICYGWREALKAISGYLWNG